METTKAIPPNEDIEGNVLVKMACDGACTPDGRAGAAWFDGKEHKSVKLPACSTNNQAEYSGLISLLEHLRDTNFPGKALILMDSQLVVYQVTGKYRVKKSGLFEFYNKVQSLLSIVEAEVMWVSRENTIMNQVDIMAKEAARS